MSDDGSPVPELAGCQASHASLLEHLRSTSHADPTAPSRLPGWTLGHVLTHLARHPDSYRSLLDGADQYRGGWEQRNREIDHGASREWSALVADVATSIELLDQASEPWLIGIDRWPC